MYPGVPNIYTTSHFISNVYCCEKKITPFKEKEEIGIRMIGKRSIRVPNSRQNMSKPRRHNWKVIAIAIYITFLLLSTIPFAADRTVETEMQESYTHYLRYPRDGRQGHYYVERVNTSKMGKIDVTYTTASNSLIVDVQNIKVLHIFCRSMYEDECKDVYGIDPMDNSNYYKWYFIEKNHLTVNINSDHQIEELSFIDTPLAYKVIVNGETWEENKDYFYEIENSGLALSHVPDGHTIVDLYFKPTTGAPPKAILTASKTLVAVNRPIVFDASQSFDTDGTITTYILDFGDGTYRSGSKETYEYSKPGTYGVILMVRDNDYLVDHAYVNITVVEHSDIPEIQGRVPDQVKPEDSPPWTLDLSNYEPIPSSDDVKFQWFLTGEYNSLYTVTGENSSDARLVFNPVPDAFGSNLVTLWLTNNKMKDIAISQPLWINLTPVNDPPTIYGIPNLILHHDDPYTFNFGPYVSDKETPKNQLELSIFDGYNGEYITISNLNATFNYPEKLVGETIYATVVVSDGEAEGTIGTSIQVTTDHVPKLIKPLPDVQIYEGTTKYNVFDLDDYFMDQDDDSIYYSSGNTHLEITIHQNHTVDMTAASEWTGREILTFRARDPIGALAEDSIVVTVLPVNDPPTISGIPNFYVHYNHEYRFDLTPYVKDNDNSTEELRIIPSDHEHVHLDFKNHLVILMMYPIEYLNQTLPLRLTVTDGLDSAYQDITVTITEDYPPELLSPIPNLVFLEDTPLINVLDLDHYFFDVDGDILYYTTGNEYVNITINADHTIDLSAPLNWFGTELVYFRATDPTGALKEDLVHITVLPVNDAPQLLALPPQYGNESERWVLDLEPYIIDVDNNITELMITLDCDDIAISGSKLIFFGTRTLPEQITVTVSDGELRASQTFELHVELPGKTRALTHWDLFMYLLPIIIMIILITIITAGVVYRKRTRFTTEEVFLIHKGGTLINHLTRHKQANVDDIIFSGMFTAVQDFIKDTFTQGNTSYDISGTENNWALDELRLGDNNILIERSENTYLAVIFSGPGSKRLRKIVSSVLDKVEERYRIILPTWDGNIRELAGTKEILSVLIKIPKEPEEQDKPKVAQAIEVSQITPPFTPTTTVGRIIKGPPTSTSIPKTSNEIPHAIVVKKQFIAEFKELFECTSEYAGADKPGLTAWPMSKGNIQSKGIKTDMTGQSASGQQMQPNRNELPVALDINPHKPRIKTIAIKKPDLPVAQPLNTNAGFPKGLDESSTKSMRIILPTKDGEKELKLDTRRSILQQLAELDEI